MKKAYHDIMERITLTPQARERILQNLQQADLSPAPPRARSPLLRWTALAACAALVLTACLTLPPLLQQEEEPDSTPPLVQSGLMEVASLEALSETVGYTVTPPKFPFQAEETVWMAYDTLAEVTCAGEGQTATFRQSPGQEDNSGDYTVYADIITVTFNDTTVTLKGQNDGLYTLALWHDEAYTYSLNLSQGLSAEEWTSLLKSS